MRTSAQIGSMFAVAALACSGAVHAADVYCPGTSYPAYTTSNLPPPSPTRYIDVSGGALPGYCYYQGGNMNFDKQNSTDLAAVIATNSTLLTGLTQIDKFVGGANASSTNAGLTVDAGAISGGYTITSSLWDSYSTILIGFHFGNGGGDPDSFLIQLSQGNTGGTWSFNPVAIANGISNFYVLGVPGGVTPPGGNTPEPASLALVSLGLLGAVYARKRRKA